MILRYTDDRKKEVVRIPCIEEPILIETPVGNVRIGYMDGLKSQIILVTANDSKETTIKLNGRNLA